MNSTNKKKISDLKQEKTSTRINEKHQFKQHFQRIEDLHFLNIKILENFLTNRAELKNRFKNRLTRKQQFQLRKSVIIARELGLLPHIQYS